MKHIQFTVRHCKLLYFTVRLSAIFGKFRTPRHDGIYLFVCRSIAPFRQFCQQIQQIAVHIKTVSLCCFNDTHHIGTGICSFICITKQKVFSIYDKWLNCKRYRNFASLTYTNITIYNYTLFQFSFILVVGIVRYS